MQRSLGTPRHTPKPARQDGKSTRPKGIDVIVGAKVRVLRVKLGLSQEKLGELLGLTFQQVQKYEKGMNSIAAARIPTLCQALGIKPADLFEGIDIGSEQNGQSNPMPEISAVAWRVALAVERLSPSLRGIVMDVVRVLNREAVE